MRLRCVEPSDLRFIYDLHTEPRIAYRTGFSYPTFRAFEQAWGRRGWIEAIVSSMKTGEPIGHALAYDLMPRSNSAFVGVAMAPTALGFARGIEAVLIFADYLFATYGFQKLYSQSAQFAYRKLSIGDGVVFHKEGLLLGHDYYDGVYHDSNIVAVTREEWRALKEQQVFLSGWRTVVSQRRAQRQGEPRPVPA